MFGTYKVKIDNKVVGIIKVNKTVSDKIVLLKEENEYQTLLKSKNYNDLNNLIYDYLGKMINDINLRDNYKKILELTRNIDINKENYQIIYKLLKESNLI